MQQHLTDNHLEFKQLFVAPPRVGTKGLYEVESRLMARQPLGIGEGKPECPLQTWQLA
jgi:hypothetical protein